MAQGDRFASDAEKYVEDPYSALAERTYDPDGPLAPAISQARAAAEARNRTFHQAAAPADPAGGSPLRMGDTWVSSDTVTNCADLNCTGRARNDNGGYAVPLGTAAPHAVLSWAHLWNGSAWLDSERKVVTREILADQIAANAYQTTDYQEASRKTYPDGVVRVVATQGAKMAAGALPFRAAAGGIYVGDWDLTHVVMRVVGAIGYTNGYFFYRGSSRGVPVVAGDRIRVWNHFAAVFTPLEGGSVILPHFNVEITRLAATDNLDGLRAMRYWTYDYGGMLTGGMFSVAIPDQVPTGGTLTVTLQPAIVSAPAAAYYNDHRLAVNVSYSGGLLLDLQNVYGVSAQRSFRNNAGATGFMVAEGIPGVTPGGGGGGSTNDPDPTSSCPAPETLVLLASGLRVPVGSLKVGDEVYTVPDSGDGPGGFRVEAVSQHVSPRLKLTMQDGRVLVASPDHFLMTTKGWFHVKDLKPEHIVIGQKIGQVRSVEPASPGPVVKVSVEGAHTYITEGLLSHNLKKIN